MSKAYLSAGAYLPHESPMVLVEDVIEVTEESAHCRVVVSASGVVAPFLNEQGDLPSWFALEMMAQTIGVWSGWHGQQNGTVSPGVGLLLGSRAFRCEQPILASGSVLDIRVTLLMKDERLGSFDTEICIGEHQIATARLNTYQPDEQEINQLFATGETE